MSKEASSPKVYYQNVVWVTFEMALALPPIIEPKDFDKPEKGYWTCTKVQLTEPQKTSLIRRKNVPNGIKKGELQSPDIMMLAGSRVRERLEYELYY